jgi:hypothetical protein
MSKRRQIGRMMGSMRLGDMSAALEGRRLDRYERRQDTADEEMRYRAANQALQSILGGVGGIQERSAALERQTAQDARQAALDDQAQKNWQAAQDLRKGRYDQDTQDRTVARLAPGLQEDARAALAGEREGVLRFDELDLDGDWSEASATEVPPEAAELERMIDTLTEAGVDPLTAKSLAQSAMGSARGGLDAEKRAKEQDAARVARLKSQAVLDGERTKTEQARQRELAAKANRPRPTAPAATQSAANPALLEGGGYPVKSENTQKWLGTADALIDDLEEVLAMVRAEGDSFDSGPLIDGVVDPVRRFVGMPEKTREHVRSTLAGPVTQRINQLIGAAQTETEMKNLAPLIPKLDQQESVFIPRLEDFVEGLKKNRANVMRAVGVEPSFRPGTGGGGAPAMGSEMATIRTPDGRVMRLPRENLPAALSMGATEVK